MGCKMLNPTDEVGPTDSGRHDQPSSQPTAHHACALSLSLGNSDAQQVGEFGSLTRKRHTALESSGNYDL
eukprot:2364135-Karenia_brevis.AAC.1